jgi:drug/metabolite transporter (DMT)-like permease
MGTEFSAVFFGMASAITWGAADFCGGVATKRSEVIRVLFFSQLIGTTLLVIPLWVWQEPFPGLKDIFWGAAGGACGLVGVTAFYIGLARGRMGVVAPVAAVVTAGIPVLAGAILEGLPPAIKYAGFALGLISIWLVSRSDGKYQVRLKELALPVIAGAAFGAFFIFLDQAAETAVLWPLLAARSASLLLILLASLVMGKQLLPARGRGLVIALAGLLDTGGNIFYMLAARAGRLDIAAVLASLYPAATVILARLILKERINRWQLIGILSALAAVVLIAT